MKFLLWMMLVLPPLGGCGDGALSAQLAGIASRGWVLGLDASRAMIAATRQPDGRYFETFRRINARGRK